MTGRVVLEMWNSKSFFVKIADVLLGEGAQERARCQFWEDVAFYNFIPRLLDWSGRSRKPAKTADFNAGWQPFVEVVNTLDPHVIWVCSKAVWDHSPSDWQEVRQERVDRKMSFYLGRYDASLRGPLIAVTWHPSRFVSPAYWTSLVASALE